MPVPFPDNLISAVSELNPTWFIIAFAFILLDVVSGFIIKGVMQHNIDSSIMREGLKHKSWEVALIACAALIDVAIGAGMALGIQLVSTLTCSFISIMEAASICENALEGNPELANAPIIKYVAKAKEATSNEVEEGDQR